MVARLVVTIGRIYIDHADRASYRRMLDEVQKVVLRLTGSRFGPKRLMPEGKLNSIGIDMESAQALALGDHFLSLNDPEYSGITTTDPLEITSYFLKICHSHVKR